MSQTELKPVKQVTITTITDNFVELLTMDNSEIVQRFIPMKDLKMRTAVLAEHGFSALMETSQADESHAVLMDFGQSEVVAPFNLEAMEIDLGKIEALALSHGHIDHTGALLAILRMMPARPVPLVLHPAAFRSTRYLKFPGDIKCHFPDFEKQKLTEAGADVIEASEPYALGEGTILFLGEIERSNDFEKGMPIAYYEDNGVERKDDIADDSALVANLEGKGLVILTGCAHAGIVNTVNYARKVTGIDDIHAIVGGYHLVGPQFEQLIARTIEELAGFSPDYVVPCHCTGRKAVIEFERTMPERFILNQSGTKLTFHN